MKDNDSIYYSHKKTLQNLFEFTDILRGEYIRPYSIALVDEEYNNDKTTFKFEVTDEFYGNIYKQNITKNDEGKILGFTCDCDNFRLHSSCTHLIGCIRWYAYKIFEEKPDINKISDRILSKFVKLSKPTLKKEVFLEVEIEKEEHKQGYYMYYKLPDTFKVKVKLGTDKMYLYNAKQTQFLNALEKNEKDYSFGKDFTYNFNENFLNENANKVFNHINTYHKDLNRRFFTEVEMTNFLELLTETNFQFKYDNHTINKIKTSFPFQTEISILDENDYTLKFNMGNFTKICKNFYFIDGDIYKVNQKEELLINELTKNNINSLIIPKDKIKDFSFGLLPIIKKQIHIDENIKNDIVIINEPDVSLYFDLNKNDVVCNLKLKYSEEIDYFDKTSTTIRDLNFENNLINELSTYGFTIEKKKIIMHDLNDIVEFIETGLNTLSKKYPVFTTENFKKMNIKKTSVSSTFSIGKDNILKYDFNLDGISNDDIVNIFKSIKEKKKYYKLSNNEIVDLEDNDLNELMDLTEELDITDEDIISAKGSVMKYRAIYLDSIKDSKYSIVKTDNLFKEFINNFHQYKDANLTLTDNELKTLRNYQITGVKWLYNLDKCSFGGILADEMGLGKTIQLIYYIKQMLKENNSFKFLIVVPTSLLYNWDREFEKFAPDIPVKIVSGIKTKRQDLIENTNKNVYITTYGLLREDLEYYEKIHYHAVILDEAQNIKNPLAGTTKACKSMKADVKFALTGTPIENSAVELWSIFDYIMPGYLSKYDKFTSKYKVKEFDEDTNKLLDSLSKQISPFILRRKKKDVIKELPEKIETNIFIELGDEQKKIYVAELNKVKEAIEEALNDGGMSKVRFMILPLLTKLRQICIDPKIVYSDYTSGSNKIDRFLSVIEEVTNNGHKVLVFTSFRTALNLVKDKLDSIGIKSYQIDGSVSSKERQTRVDNFNNNDDVKVFLIMLKSGGTGLNLASADIVIHLDLWWNPQAENQATDRAHRIGQKNTVEVIKLVSKGTIEEKVLDLQEKKKELSNRLIDSNNMDQNIISELTEKDIKNLLAFENRD